MLRVARRSKAARVGLGLLGTLVWGPTTARADGVAQVLTNKTLPPATVALIDPETGTSSGGGTTDVKVGPGDVILFRFKYFPVPDKIVRGLQGYLTEYIPANTEVVGVRIVDANGLTIPPRYPGISVDGCAGNCPGFSGLPSGSGPRTLPNGSIAQIYADTGVFYSTATPTQATPADSFLTLKNGVLMSPEPRNVGAITGLLGTSSPLYAHQAWDWAQVRAYGINNPGGNASKNGGTGVTPHLYGSPVAGPLTHYRFEASEPSPGVIQFNDTPGPWQRIVYPGAQVGTGVAATTAGALVRVNQDTTSGFDLKPATPLPAGTQAVRFALGEVRVGEPGYAEIALRVKATPLDPVRNRDVDCAEVFGGDTSAASATVRGRDNPWPTYLTSPACVYLNLLFDLEVDKPLAKTGEVLTYTLTGKNLSLNTQNQASVRLKYDSNDVAYVAGSASVGPGGAAAVVSNCDGDGKTCLVWPPSDLSRSAEYKLTAQFTVGGGGHVTNVMFANYRSTQLPAPGFTTQALTVIREVAVVKVDLSAASSTGAGGVASFSGNLFNPGTGTASLSSVSLILPSGWAVSGPVKLSGVTLTCTSGCAGSSPTFSTGVSLQPGQSQPLTFGASVPPGTATGLYEVDLQVWASQTMFGGAFETYFPNAARAAVGASRSTAPAVDCPIGSAATQIAGSTSEPDGTTIRVYLNGIVRGTATASAGRWVLSNLASFGTLYGGLEVRASAVAAGELESELGEACFVSVSPACSDGRDNDGDGKVDFPGDPGCSGPLDTDESDVGIQCADGLDNDGDGKIDWPADPGCADAWDQTEGGNPACSDGLDNDGDGLVDYPNDPDCSGPLDASEILYPACSDGVDNDGDGKTDFPADPGCHSAFDPSEVDLGAQAATRPRLLIAFDTSGSMNWSTCDATFTGGDGSRECPGSDMACMQCQAAGCGDGQTNDSRLAKVKAGLTDVLRAFGEVDFGLMRFHQRAEPFSCPTAVASLRSGGWQGAGAAPCGDGFSAGDLLVSFSPDNRAELLRWMDGQANYAGTPPPGFDHELRGSGTTPLGGILQSAQTHLGNERAADPRAACRPYRVVLVTDGGETCGGNPVAAASALRAAGINVHVIGFATSDPTITASLDAIAQAGGTTKAVLAGDASALSAAMAGIINASILIETCNGVDDDCDGLIDEDFPDKGNACSNGEKGICSKPGTRVCRADGFGTRCDAPPGTAGTETCPANGQDDDCNGVVDDVPGGCPACTPEVCNGQDDDCDGTVDEEADIFPCANGSGACLPPCGSNIGICRPGTLRCTGGALTCSGSVGAQEETCNGVDDDCNTVIDGFSRRCYPSGTPGCDPAAGTCMGICRFGAEHCPRLESPAAGNAYGACLGAITPQMEVCNGLDDDCDGTVDNVPEGCENTCIVKPEVCNGLDDDCDGIVDEMPEGEGDPCVSGYDPAKAGIGVCRPGQKVCVAGAFRCEGEVGPGAEICDGFDNDCDGQVDVGAPCPGQFACTLGGCQPECTQGEFACAADRVCLEATTLETCTAPGRQGCACVPNPCLEAGCDPGRAVCRISMGAASCLDRCPPDACPAGKVCQPWSGSCVDCHTLGCPAGEVCTGSPGTCRADPCLGVSCQAGQYCVDGQCQGTCTPACTSSQICVAGRCQAAVCDVACGPGMVCNPEANACQADLCTMACPQGLVCIPKTGSCAEDRCATVACGDCSLCQTTFDGTPTCVPDSRCLASAGRIEIGRSGCACDLGGRDPAGGSGPIWAAFLLAGWLIRRRRVRGGGGR